MTNWHLEDLPERLRGIASEQCAPVAHIQREAVTVAPKPSRPRHIHGEMNKTEAAYAEYLNRQRLAGEIISFAFEPAPFKLADRCFYTPDFLVMRGQLFMEVHEVKGHMEGDAAVKLRVFREKYPEIGLVIVRRNGTRGDQWEFERR